jgi:elongation factor Tu
MDMVEDLELVELVELEIREMLDMYQFPGDDTPFIKGSALKALNGDTGEYGVPAILELVKAVDTFIPEPDRAVDKPFLMGIESVMSITGKGTVATGRIERGIVKAGEAIEITGIKDKPLKGSVVGIEMFHKTLPEGQAGDQCGIMLKGVKKSDIQRGQVIAVPGSVKTAKGFDADVYVLKEDEGGRKKPFFTKYRPQAFIRTGTITVEVTLPDDVEMAMPGDSLSIKMSAEKPVPVEEGLRFALREGGLTVGSGIITKFY